LNYIVDFFTNRILISSLLAMAIAQSLKIITFLMKNKHLDFKPIFSNGGMPSSHSSFVMCMTTGIGLTEGFNSPLFAACLVVSLIIMQDAAGIRRSAGDQAKILNKLVKKWSEHEPISLDKGLKELVGHTPIQVLAGALLGVSIAFISKLI